MQSIVAQNSPSEEYLSDYVYIDQVRLSHYYSQLSTNGLVTGSKKISKAIGKQSSDLNVKLLAIGGKVAGETTSEDALELQIDSAFTRPQETLDALFDAGYIGNGLTGSRMGQLVLTKGQISLFDIRLLKEMWPLFGGIMADEAIAQIQSEKQRNRIRSEKKKEFDQLASIMSKIPHSLQGTLAETNQLAWFSLIPDYMLVSPEDLSFKHGADLHGEWHILGIVDALPSASPPTLANATRGLCPQAWCMRCDSQGLGARSVNHGREPCGLIVAQALQSFKLHVTPLQ